MGPGEALTTLGFFAMIAIIFVARSRIGEAIADRIRGSSGHPENAPLELDDMRGELDGLRQELLDVHERLDFAERVLAQRAAPAELPRGGS